jgi:hypothetical protein
MILEEDDDVQEKRVDGETIECQLFSWDGWDGDLDCMIFYKPVLKVQIGKYPPGTTFDSATILFDKSILQFDNTGEWELDEKGRKLHANNIPMGSYKLKLSVGETIEEA